MAVFHIQRYIMYCVAAVLVLLAASCQQPYYGSGNVGVKDHSDSVVHINQVDPAYRRYFADQHDSNYSLQDQRKAFYEAVKTSKTPVQQDARHAKVNASKKNTSSRSKSRASSKKAKKSSKKKVVKRKAPAKKSAKKKSTSRRKR